MDCQSLLPAKMDGGDGHRIKRQERRKESRRKRLPRGKRGRGLGSHQSWQFAREIMVKFQRLISRGQGDRRDGWTPLEAPV